MKYIQARPLIRSGDILAFSHGNWKTWSGIKTNMVRIFTRSTYSHVGIAWVVGSRVFVLEAVKPRLRIFPLSQSGDFYLIGTGVSWSFGTEEYALAKVGTLYSELAAMRAFFDPLEEGNVEQCAAYVREVLKYEGLNLGTRSTPDAVVAEALKLEAAEVIYVEASK